MAVNQSIPFNELSPIAGVPDYFVTPTGRVFTNRVSTRHRRGGYRELKQSVLPTGYRYVRMVIDRRSVAILVHRILATTFIPRSDDTGTVVRHLDGNPANNEISNLAWGTQADNMADCVRHGRTLKGTKNPNAKLDDTLVRVIRERCFEGETQADVADSLGVHLNTVNRAIRGEHWGHVDG